MSELAVTLERLTAVIAARRSASPETSYVAKLFVRGRKKIAQKIGEEGVELTIAAVRNEKDEIIEESADLLFHLLVLWEDAGVTQAQIAEALRRREGLSGLEEKRMREK